MNRVGVAGLACAAALALGSPAVALTTFTFSGVSGGATGSAEMDIDLVGSTLTVDIRNTSPTTYGVSSTNLASIMGFGFNFDGAIPAITSWTMTAYNAANAGLTIGDNDQASGTDYWNLLLNDSVEGVTLDFFPQNAGPDASSNIDGGLYNPALAGTIGDTEGSNTHFFTEATLTVVFASAPTLDLTLGDDTDKNPYVRMQRVGDGGSLKLAGTDQPPGDDDDDFEPPPPGAVPEPVTGALGAASLAALAVALRRRRV